MNSCCKNFLVCLALAAPSGELAAPARGAELVLREHAVPRGSVVRLSDVADVTGDAAALRLADMPLMPAPAPGTTSYLRAAELRDLLSARGIEVRGITFRGAELVTIACSGTAANAASTAATGKPAAAAPTADDAALVAEQLAAAIVDYLRRQTGHDLWRVQVEADPPIVAAFRRAGGRATLSGGRAPWTGRQRFSISGEAAVATAVYARVDRQEMALTALRSIARGELIRRGDVQLQPHVGALPAGALASIEAAIGKEAVQTIRAESLVTANQVRMPTIVRRGERVSVRARAAGVTVRTFAVAQQDGGLGDLVTVQAIDGKERFTARVAGLRELEIMAAGVSAADVAAAVR